MLEFNISFILQFVNFLLLVYLLNKFLFKPVMGILEKRQDNIQGRLKSAEESQRNGEAVFAQYKEGIISARREAADVLASAQKDAAAGQRETIEVARAKAESMIAVAKRDIEEAVEKQKGRLRDEAKKLSTNIAEKLLGRAI